ncbi:MAG: response regulator [Rhodospirillales bacterium]|jgi:two-component system, chemotaxis family, chemotaxis protein CheY|nr:response regulator [Rhodospirillales bacterium]
MSTASGLSSVIVLVVEDEAFSLRFVSRILQKIGITSVLEAENGTDALTVLEDSENKIDLIITDIEMPEMDGYELVRRVRYGAVPQYKDIPILMLTGQDTDSNVQKARIHKINGYIVKPPKIDQLQMFIEGALGL